MTGEVGEGQQRQGSAVRARTAGAHGSSAGEHRQSPTGERREIWRGAPLPYGRRVPASRARRLVLTTRSYHPIPHHDRRKAALFPERPRGDVASLLERQPRECVDPQGGRAVHLNRSVLAVMMVGSLAVLGCKRRATATSEDNAGDPQPADTAAAGSDEDVSATARIPEPPADRAEEQGAAPSERHVWVNGHWRWTARRASTCGTRATGRTGRPPPPWRRRPCASRRRTRRRAPITSTRRATGAGAAPSTSGSAATGPTAPGLRVLARVLGVGERPLLSPRLGLGAARRRLGSPLPRLGAARHRVDSPQPADPLVVGEPLRSARALGAPLPGALEPGRRAHARALGARPPRSWDNRRRDYERRNPGHPARRRAGRS